MFVTPDLWNLQSYLMLMKISPDVLIDDLSGMVRRHIAAIENLRQLDLDVLQQRPSHGSWNALECIEHLNRYGDFYIPEVRGRIEGSQYRATDTFRSGLLGDYFARTMLPGEKATRMKTLRAMNPAGVQLNKNVLDRFTDQQQGLAALLEQARNVNLSKTKTAISISSFIRLRLGDTLRVVIYHDERHVLQAKRAVNRKHVGV
jgi:hypothetical protein